MVPGIGVRWVGDVWCDCHVSVSLLLCLISDSEVVEGMSFILCGTIVIMGQNYRAKYRFVSGTIMTVARA